MLIDAVHKVTNRSQLLLNKASRFIKTLSISTLAGEMTGATATHPLLTTYSRYEEPNDGYETSRKILQCNIDSESN